MSKLALQFIMVWLFYNSNNNSQLKKGRRSVKKIRLLIINKSNIELNLRLKLK